MLCNPCCQKGQSGLLGSLFVQVLASFERKASTNQRIGFDLSADSRGLITASQDGRVSFRVYSYSVCACAYKSVTFCMRFFRLLEALLRTRGRSDAWECMRSLLQVLVYDCTQPEQPPAVWLTFGDAANAAALHPSLPLLAVAVGERHFTLPGCERHCIRGLGFRL